MFITPWQVAHPTNTLDPNHFQSLVCFGSFGVRLEMRTMIPVGPMIFPFKKYKRFANRDEVDICS